MKAYQVIAEPIRYATDVPRYGVKAGMIVYSNDHGPDGDGELNIYFSADGTAEGPDGDKYGYVLLDSLMPVEEVMTGVVGEIGTATVKVTPDLSDFAAAVVESIASALEEAAAAIRAARL